MANQKYTKQKHELSFSKNRISKAGRAIRKGASGEDRLLAIEIIHDFRASHAYPLMLIKNHIWRKARTIESKAVVARRLKRLPTIINKLERPSLDGSSTNATDIVRMQDIGGARAIFKNIKSVYALLEKLNKSKCIHKIKSITDYCKTPKESGYRGLHVVFSCYSNQEEKTPWQGHKVEVQIRSRLQHAWSTTVEMIDLYENTSLKTGMVGDVQWRGFFQSLGHILANQEKISSCTEEQLNFHIKRLKRLEKILNVKNKLSSFSMATDTLLDNSLLSNTNGVFLLKITLDKDGFTVTPNWYKEADRSVAVKHYDELESDETVFQAVLIAASGAGTIVQAYPNFFADTSLILSLLREITGEGFIPSKRN